MENMKQEVVISQKFKDQLDKLNILEQIEKPCTNAFPGTVRKIDDDLFILYDNRGAEVCGLLDCKSFMEALMDTDVSHLWAYDNSKKYGAAN